MRTLLAVVCVVGSLVLGAKPAAAQWDAFGVCADQDIASLFDPNAFVGLDQCPKLCAKSASICNKFSKGTIACDRSSIGALYGITEKTECAPLTDPNERKDCFASIKQGRGIIKGLLSDDLANMLDDCNAFLEQCQTSCIPL